MRRKFTKALSLILSLLLTFTVAGSLTACNPDNGSGKTEIEISGFDLGLGGTWFVDCTQRFEDKYADKEYAPGVKGVKVNINEAVQSLANIQTDGNAIFITGLDDTLAYHVQKGDFLNINDILTEDLEMIDGEMKSIADKIPEADRSMYQVNGEYYVAPEVEYYAATTYDRNLFNNEGLYLAKDTQGDKHESNICKQNYYFVNGDATNKSCGPDGVFNTEDDGLPSSLFELAALCEYMKTRKTISPFAVSGEYKNYCNALFNALMVSLQGYTASDMFTLDSDGFEIITGWTNENLFPGIDYIKKPITETIPITEETGYYTTWSADKYYAEAFVEMATKEGWWFSGTAMDTNSHTDAQADFIYSGYGANEKIGMLVEFSYWYNEATFSNSFDYFYSEYNYVTERDIAFMPMPINLSETVAEGEGEKPSLIAVNNSYFIVNKNIEDDPALVEAVKDFMRFYFSETELSRTTVDFGVAKRLNYSIKDEDKENFSDYCESMWNMRTNGNVVRIQGNTDTFRGNKGLFGRGFTDGAFGISGYRSCFSVIYDRTKTAKECFELQMIDKDAWGSTYLKKAGATAGDYNGLVYSK